MSYAEFFKALTPYNYKSGQTMEKYMKDNKERVDHILQIADVDKNGQISFTEFFFFILLT